MQNTVDGVFTLFRGDFNLHHLIHDHTTLSMFYTNRRFWHQRHQGLYARTCPRSGISLQALTNQKQQ
ncbi:Uncharacterised protein [Vibrio cholerae]|nr:Uncharacterised protein [Vibrio cholerae]